MMPVSKDGWKMQISLSCFSLPPPHYFHHYHSKAERPLTGLVGGDVYRDMLCGVRALVAHSVNSLNLKAIKRVRQQVADEDSGFSQAQLPRDKFHIFVAVRAGAAVSAALPADYVVNHITATTGFSGRMPLQDHRSLIHNGDHVSRTGWDTCNHNRKTITIKIR